MENKESIGGFEVFDSPEALSASMTAEPQQTETTTEEAPQQESQPVQESIQPEPQVETTSEPVEQTPQQNIQQETVAPQQNTIEYSDDEVEGAVFNYLSEKLGRDISSLDALSEPQQTALDERIEAIARFVEDTGRAPKTGLLTSSSIHLRWMT